MLLNKLNNDIHKIYKRIMNDTNAVILKPNNKHGDPWFFLTYIFSIAV